MTTKTLYLFFSAHFKKGKPFPDPDAKIGYCSAKKLAFVGYRATLIIGRRDMPILDYYITPANRHDSKALCPLLLSMERHGTIERVGDFYGDNAYASRKNEQWLIFYGKQSKFHSKDETGKKPKSPHSAKKKSRIRSKVEAIFGIMEENYNFGHTRLRRINNVKTELCLMCTAWDHFFLMSYIMDRFNDRISLRRLFYEN